jgi:hypothetical protein
MAYVIPPIRSLDLFRKQLNAMFVDLFGASNTFTAAQTFPAAGIVLGTVKVMSGADTPEGAVTAPVGSLFLRTNGGAGTCLYVKESGTGNTGWVEK